MSEEHAPGGAEVTGLSRVNARGEPDAAGTFVQIVVATNEDERYYRITLGAAERMVASIQAALGRTPR